jgi:hypothetical protein
VVYTFSPYPRIAGGIDSNRDPRSRGPGMGRRAHCPCRWNEVVVRCGRLSGLPIGGTNRQSSAQVRETGDWATDAGVGSGATSAIRSASCEAASRLPLAWPAGKVWMWVGSLFQALQMVQELKRFALAPLFVC